MIPSKILKRLRVTPGRRVKLKKYPTDHVAGFAATSLGEEALKNRALEILGKRRGELSSAQELLYANGTYAVLLIFQAMDAGGKDGTIRHVMSGLNPQGCQVFSFKAPSAEERDHTYLWRSAKAVPERGRIGIHNRSHYEEVLVARVHPEILQGQRLPAAAKNDKDIWQHRFKEINDFERHLVRNGTIVLKFFLNVSRAEQKRRFLERIDDPSKNWKFEPGDLAMRERWDDFMAAYEAVLNKTSTPWAPWHVVPADRKWFRDYAVAQTVVTTLEDMKLKWPKPKVDLRKFRVK